MNKVVHLWQLIGLLLVLGAILAGCGQPTAQQRTVEADALLDAVSVVRAGGARSPLPAPQRSQLAVGDGVDVDAVGRAVLRFADLLTVEVLRDGDLVFQTLSADAQGVLVSVAQGAGSALYDFNPTAHVQRRLSVQADAAVVLATGTQFLVVREAETPLTWVLALDAAPSDLTVTAAGVTVAAPSGVARWVAPVDGPGAAIVFDAPAVVRWIQQTRSGQAVPEIGEVLWPQADVIADTTPLDTLPAPGAPFFLEGVQLELDPEGLSGSPE